ncbi:hypothetical protein ACWCPM_05610 [Streptomyces sp. NPDC002309]
MSHDFAAIISAVMAALLVLLIAEFQAGVRNNTAVARALSEEYAAPIKESFLAHYNGTPLPSADQARVDKELSKYQQLRRSSQVNVAWQLLFLIAVAALVVALCVVLFWAAHPAPATGNIKQTTDGTWQAKTALWVTGSAFVILGVGFFMRYAAAYNFRRLQASIKLAKECSLTDSPSEVRRRYTEWEDTLSPRPLLSGPYAMSTAFIDPRRWSHWLSRYGS